ncbi:MAG TPA: FAD-dependent monooxygenase [Pseudonocardia sp.]|jgi:anthraniloyl-CoA monooxygenase
MRIVCVGAGPAGLYFAILSKLRDPAAEVTVLERNPRGVTYGWGVVFWDDLMHGLRHGDPVSAASIESGANQWHDQEVHVGDAKPAHMGGYGYSIGRALLLDILTRRAEALGVDVRFDQVVDDAAIDSDFSDADLVVAADGVNSRLRARHEDDFGTTVDSASNYYIWLGTHKLFDVFTFAFEKTAAGWVWLHGYQFDDTTSTCIIECSPETWKGLRLDTLDTDEGIALLEGVFARELGGNKLINQTGPNAKTSWLRFNDVTNRRWWHGRVALMCDAAHTTHFSIGSGTKLAIEDAVGLDRAMRAHQDVPAALAAYERDRATAVAERQGSARSSTAWFEHVDSHIDTDPTRFAYSLRTRRDGKTAGGVSFLLHRATQYRAGRLGRRLISSTKRKLRPPAPPQAAEQTPVDATR